MVGCTSGPKDSDSRTIGTVGDYDRNLKLAQDFSRDGLLAYEAGEELTQDQRLNLERSEKLVTSMTGFNPSSFAPFVLLGKIQLALAENEKAERSLLQAVSNVPVQSSPEDLIVLGEAHAELAKLALLKNELVKAELHAGTAMEMSPKSSRLLALMARVKIQQKKIDDAKKLLEESFALDPSHTETKDLIQLIKMAGKGTPPE